MAERPAFQHLGGRVPHRDDLQRLRLRRTSSQSVTLTVGPNVQPTAGTLSISRIDGAVPAGWGVYVQGYSKAAHHSSGSKAGTGQFDFFV